MFSTTKTVSLAMLSVFCCVSLRTFATNTVESPSHYTVSVDPKLTELRVTACFPSEPPSSISASSPRAASFLQQVRVGKRKETGLRARGDRIRLQGWGPDRCIEYSVDVRAAAQSSRSHRYQRSSPAVLLPAGTWLWLPTEQHPFKAIELRFVLPAGMAVSAPWHLIERTQHRTVYRIGQTPNEWPVLVAIGRFKVESIEVPGAVLRLAALDGWPPAQEDSVRAWIRHGALSVTKLYGRFPIPSPQVLVVPIGATSEPVPWGQVLRGGSPAAQLYIDQTRPSEEFIHDWTLVHELSHMVLPYIRHTEPWLYEGIATYYQNVLQARMGTLSEHRAWQKLHEGFQRGLSGTSREITLADAAESMHRTGAYMRVYWSGAAIALLADLKLRRRGQSLDRALSDLQKCCLPSNRKWTAKQITEKLDELTDSHVFSDLYAQYVYADAFPDLKVAYDQLGLMVKNDTLHLNDSAPLAQVRKAITQTAPP